MIKYYLSIIIVCLVSGLVAQVTNIPAPAQSGAILILGAKAHLGDGRVIENAAIGFANGKITLVADATTARIDRREYREVIDAQGKDVYPGFILPNTATGLVEVSSLADTDDSSEDGSEFTPNVRAIVAYNTDSEVIPTLRFNGILMAQATPAGGVVSGQSTVVQLDAWNWEDAAYRTDDGIHINWPLRQTPPRRFFGETDPRPNPNYDKHIQLVEGMYRDAIAYGQEAAHASTNLALAAAQGLFDGSKTLYIHTDDARSMIESVNLAKQYGVKKIVLIGAAEALLVKDFIKDNNIPVIIEGIHEVPRRDHEDTVEPYKMAKALHDAGILFGLGSSQGPTRARNLPFTAGTCVAYGLPYEEAIKALTGNTAQILGVGDRTGTLETGKDATLFISQGDALDMRTNILERAFIQGRQIQLEGRQQFLYKKYSDKYGNK